MAEAGRQRTTDELIGALGMTLRPVRPLAPPVLRALALLCAIGIVVGAFVAWRGGWPLFAARNADARNALECAAMLATGIVAVVAAFHASVPGRSAAWRWAPLPPLALWLAASGASCLHNGLGLGAPGARYGESPGCFAFIVGASVPLALLLGWALRRSKPIEPLPVALLGALGVASLAAFTLQFFHPFDTTAIDLLFHSGAVIVVLALAGAARRALE